MDKEKALERVPLEEAATIYPGFPSGNVIETKRAQGYLQDCDEMWLLIVADGRYMSSTGELLQEEVRVSQLQTAFQRVLFYDRWNKQVTSLTG